MESRMDKYKEKSDIPSRSSKNKDLYKQVYNNYDEFENLVVPSNSREIDLTNLKREISSRDEYREALDYSDITNNKVVRKERVLEEQKKENEIYDINELLNKAVSEKKGPELIEPTLTNDDYLKKLKLDNKRTNIEQVKEIYEDIKEETMEEDESLLKTANLSLDILSDLKGDNDATLVCAPIKDEEMPDDEDESDFYSSKYKFSKKDFEGNQLDKKIKDQDIDDLDEDDEEPGRGKLFFKILLLVFGIVLTLGILYFIFNYFNRV